MEIAILALGCFWGPEQKFSKIDGIIEQRLVIVEVILKTQLIRKFVPGQLTMLKLLNLNMMKKLSLTQIY